MMSHDIWIAVFKSFTRKSDDTQTFRWYAVFTWCLATVIVFVAVILDFFSDFAVNYGGANYGYWWIQGTVANHLFYSVPAFVLLGYSSAAIFSVLCKLDHHRRIFLVGFPELSAFIMVYVLHAFGSFQAGYYLSITMLVLRNLRGLLVFGLFIAKGSILRQLSTMFVEILGQSAQQPQRTVNTTRNMWNWKTIS